MSKMTVCIKRINEHLERISGLDGIATELLEIEERHISEVVAIIEKHFSDADIFNYYGKPNPVRHGEWLHNDIYLPSCAECSECGWKSSVSGDEIPSYHYCPNCGICVHLTKEKKYDIIETWEKTR